MDPGQEPQQPDNRQGFFQRYGIALLLAGISIFSISASLILLFKTTQTSEPIRFSRDEATAGAVQRTIVADIEGAVVAPGVYELVEGSRVGDLLDKAGGLTGEADSEWVGKNLNRADFLSDGAKLFILRKGDVQGQSAVKTDDGGQKAEYGQQKTDGKNTLVSINFASEKELDTLPGVGPVTAGKIISGRPYQRLEELVEKKAVSPSVFEKIKGEITL